MRKKFLHIFTILTVAMTMLFGSVLTVSAEEINSSYIEDFISKVAVEESMDSNITVYTKYPFGKNSEKFGTYCIMPMSYNSSSKKYYKYTDGIYKFAVTDSLGDLWVTYFRQSIPVVVEPCRFSAFSNENFIQPDLSYENSVIFNWYDLGTFENGVKWYYTSVKISGEDKVFNVPEISVPGTYQEFINQIKTKSAEYTIENLPEIPKEDENFTFVDFKGNEYVSATWNGTSFDDRKEEFDTMGYEVVVGYAMNLQIMTHETILENGDLSTNKWSKKLELLKHEDETLYTRYVSFTPFYTVGSQKCKGKSSILWFDANGNLDYVPTGELTMLEDSSFYIKGLSIEESNIGIIDGSVRSHISWTGTTKDDMIAKIPLDKSYADLLVLCYDSSYKPIYKDLYDIDPDFQGGQPLSLRRAINDSSQAFYLNTSLIDDRVTALGLTFSGKIYITPYFFYESENTIYKGSPSVVSLFSNTIPTNPDPVPTPSIKPNPSASPTSPLDGGEITIENSLGTFWDILRSLFNNLGQLPQLLKEVFPFIPDPVFIMIGAFLVIVLILRILGR